MIIHVRAYINFSQEQFDSHNYIISLFSNISKDCLNKKIDINNNKKKEKRKKEKKREKKRKEKKTNITFPEQ